ncbi:hypothetical protein [Dyadobacter sp. Leaf189]|uniref:hypothetical protein n=1 Tax=Dyadobacter sp. Leaf189 TaxID=1736295 RepID=UPI0006F86B3E|nr:hypothetical protein [Dyadobacter sp. Leaf189]KQS32734.1 hypothetical protein ASG33_01055 [Dyadobacter sp. Leaf189]
METWDEMVKRHTGERKSMEDLHNGERRDAERAGESEMFLKMLESQQKYAVDAIHTRQVGQAKDHPDWEKGLENGPSMDLYITEQEKVQMELNDIAQWTREMRASKEVINLGESNAELPKQTRIKDWTMMDELQALMEKIKPKGQDLEP